jgi:hypothetical protein
VNSLLSLGLLNEDAADAAWSPRKTDWAAYIILPKPAAR